MKLLAVGVATLDIISQVTAYPVEDAEVRALEQRLARGGNATNTLVVLSQLGHRCSWAGTLAEGADAEPILQDLARYRIDTSACRRLPGTSPISCVLLSRASGSRTIVHHRKLPEYTAEDFARIQLGRYDWVHFEGRNVPETLEMLRRLRDQHPQCPVSLELEKPRAGIERLIPYVDLLLSGRAYARAKGHGDGPALLHALRDQNPRALLFAAWGEQGGWVQAPGEVPQHRPARPPARLVDSLGAGDVFNAAVIHGISQGDSPDAVLGQAVALAGRKCGQQGLAGLVSVHG